MWPRDDDCVGALRAHTMTDIHVETFRQTSLLPSEEPILSSRISEVEGIAPNGLLRLMNLHQPVEKRRYDSLRSLLHASCFMTIQTG
jgi:hypothetical protein